MVTLFLIEPSYSKADSEPLLVIGYKHKNRSGDEPYRSWCSVALTINLQIS
jgi:hypothetical protein